MKNDLEFFDENIQIEEPYDRNRWNNVVAAIIELHIEPAKLLKKKKRIS